MTTTRDRIACLVVAFACALVAGCGGGSSSDDDPASSSSTSTSTTTMDDTSSTSSSTSSTVPSATTTTLVGQGSVPITFSLADAATVGALQFDVDYSRAPGLFEGAGVDVECSGLVSGILLSHYNETGDETLRIGMLSLGGFTGPTDLVRCTFVFDPTLPAPKDFDITIVDVTGPDLFPIVPEPTVVVSVAPPS